ncbi:MAG TPA: DUF1840 family protein [Halothiobacillus sp.]|nr:DUF1840 family protein [Halothiobacillus sp.]
MMVTFTCKADSSITMPERDAFFLLEIMGQKKVIPGSLLEEDVPNVLKRLKLALDAANAANTPEGLAEVNSLKTVESMARVLVDLLEAAEKNTCNVTWFEAPSLV